MRDPERENRPSEGAEEYQKMLLVDELESILEDLDSGDEVDFIERLAGLSEQGIKNRDDLARRIAALHSELDSSDA